MTQRDSQPDDARPLPQRPRPGTGSGTGSVSDDQDDVYVVDVRGRKRPSRRSSAGDAGLSSTRAMPVRSRDETVRPRDEAVRPRDVAGERPRTGRDGGRGQRPAARPRDEAVRPRDEAVRPRDVAGERPRTGRDGGRGERPAARPSPAAEPPRRPREPGDPRAPREGGGTGQPGRPRRRGRRIAAVVSLVLLAWVAFMVFTPFHAWSSVTKVDTTPAGARPAETKGFTYLLVGSDSREGLTAADKRKLGTGSSAGKRTDSIILVHVPQSGGKSSLISLPRDSYVPIPGHGSNKINAAYSFGGPNLLVQTVEQVTGLRLDGYVEIGFGGFAQVVDSLGGVNICVPFTMNDPKAHINLAKGCQDLDGPHALGFVRARYSDPRGDIGRADRQRQFLGAIMKKALSPSTILIPTRYWGFSHAAASGLVVGDDTSLRDATRVLQAMRATSNGQALSLVVPIADANYATNAGSSVKWDTARAKALFTALRNDEPLTKAPPGTDGKPTGG